MQTQTTAANTPISVCCELSVIGPFEARLILSVDCAQGISVAAISLEAGESFCLNGGGGQCAVVDGEVLAIVARHHGDVIAGGVYQVSLSYYQATGSLIIERVASNLDFIQADKTPVEPAQGPAPTEQASYSTSNLAYSSMDLSPEKIWLSDLLSPTWNVEVSG